MPPPYASGTAVVGGEHALARKGPLTRLLGRRAARGDSRAFAQIFERYHQEIYRYCLTIVRNHSDAEDALQATMAAALRSLPGEDREIELKPWLYRVAHNEAISIMRRRREDPMGEVPEESAAGTEAEAESRERLRNLVSDLQALPERQRAALVMRELSGLGYEEIGTALSCTAATARQTVYEARLALLRQKEGRALSCEQVRRAVSDRDGRRLRGRTIKAHLASCEPCADFRAAIATRRDDLALLAPPLPAAAATALLGALGTGGGGAAGSVAGGIAAVGGSAGGSLAAKASSVIVAGALAVGAADFAGVVELPDPLRPTVGERAPAAPGATRPEAALGAADALTRPAAAGGSAVGGDATAARGRSQPARSKARAAGNRNAVRKDRTGPAQPSGLGPVANTPHAAPVIPPGHGGTPPGQAKEANGPAPHANAPGAAQRGSQPVPPARPAPAAPRAASPAKPPQAHSQGRPLPPTAGKKPR